MAFDSHDVVPIQQASARFLELADEVQGGSEKLITKHGQGYVALVGAERLAHDHRMEREHAQLLKLEDARLGLEDVVAGRTEDALLALRRRRKPPNTLPGA